MPYMGDKADGQEARDQLKKDLSLRMLMRDEEKREELIEEVESFQWEHSSFKDPGGDWNKLHLTLKDGSTKVLSQKGY